MRKISLYTMLVLLLLISGCTKKTEVIIIPECQWEFTGTMNEQIPISSFASTNSTVVGNTDNFINRCKPVEINPLLFKDSKIKTHQIILGFDAIYPINRLEFTNYQGDKAKKIEHISIELSLNGNTFKRSLSDYSLDIDTNTNIIDFENQSARFVKLIFQATENETYGIQDLRFFLGDGVIVIEDMDWSNAFLRYEYWTGADGIFSYNMNGDNSIGSFSGRSGFVFSDTFTGPVNSFNGLRNSNRMINNSIGYYDGNPNISEGMSFDYPLNSAGLSKSAFDPDKYIGYSPSNLLDNDGLSIYQDPNGLLTNKANGYMWLSDKKAVNHIILDFKKPQSLGDMYLYNFNENPEFGVKQFQLSYSQDGISWMVMDLYNLNQASGNPSEPYTRKIDLNNTNARYLKLNFTQTYDSLRVGLGKILITDTGGDSLFAEVSASDYDETVVGNEVTSRLWLQDGIIIGNYFYIFPILVKDFEDIFRVTRVGLIKVPIVNDEFDHENAMYYNSPLQTRTPDGGIIYYGAGVMNNTSIDGYVYVYGYKDLNGRFLTVARTTEENIEDFNSWTYFDGENWSKNINDSFPMINKVSPELSVTYIDEGMFKGKYMLISMENTTSGRVVYSISDTPHGEFSDFTLLYETTESSYLRGAFSYNAKMHPHLSEAGSYLISYNVNTTIMSALTNVDIYRPRFIRVIEVKKP